MRLPNWIRLSANAMTLMIYRWLAVRGLRTTKMWPRHQVLILRSYDDVSATWAINGVHVQFLSMSTTGSQIWASPNFFSAIQSLSCYLQSYLLLKKDLPVTAPRLSRPLCHLSSTCLPLSTSLAILWTFHQHERIISLSTITDLRDSRVGSQTGPENLKTSQSPAVTKRSKHITNFSLQEMYQESTAQREHA